MEADPAGPVTGPPGATRPRPRGAACEGAFEVDLPRHVRRFAVGVNRSHVMRNHAGVDAVAHEPCHPAMVTTIDAAGRIVVPKRLRERFNLVAGAELEIETNGDSLQLRKVDSTPALVRKKGILVHRGDARRALDIVAFMRSETDSRSRRIAREGAE